MQTIPIAQIVIPQHRKTRGSIEQLASSIRDLGLLNPITLTTSYRLIAGYHRYLACKSLGWEDIPANIVTLDALHAELAEIDENLQRQELTVLERAEQLARRKEIYEEMYPQTKKGIAQSLGMHLKLNHNVTAESAVTFSKDTASKIGISERAIEVDIQIANDIAPDVKESIREMPLANQKTELLKISQMKPEQQRAVVERITSGAKTITEATRLTRRAETHEAEPPAGKYRVIYADPPWAYNDKMTDSYGTAEYHYPTMSMADICALPIRDLADDNAVLFLWTTSPLLEETFDVIKAWGFKYKTSFVWDKVKHNMGHYNSVRHEFLLVCTHGSCTPEVSKLFDSVITEERTTHSAKPQTFRTIIETLYPSAKKIELFARIRQEGWETWGNQ